MDKFEDGAVVSGIGQSAVGRWLTRSALDLTLDAVDEALADAGLARSDVDGLAAYPGGGTSIGPGFAGPPLVEVAEAMAIHPRYLMGNFEGPAQLGPVLNACLAVAAGLATHVVVYRTVTEGSARVNARTAGAAGGSASTGAAAGPAGRWVSACGGGPAPVGFALLARQHFDRYGTTREQLGQVALVARRHAARNPKAVWRDPLTLEDYLAARMIAEPLCLYDCDVHCDGSTAVVVSRADRAGASASPPVRIEAMGTAPAPDTSYRTHDDLQPGRRAADELWSRTDLRPGDVDVAGIYDGFSILTLMWLEALGFCGRGESGAFVEGGARIGLGGELPLNTQGGQLSGGRLHGLGFVHEVCLQLRGRASGRQVDGARVGLVAVGALPYVGCLLLRAGER